MSDSSHLFVFEEVKVVKYIGDDPDETFELKAVFMDSTTQKEVQLNLHELGVFAMNWIHYAGNPEASLESIRPTGDLKVMFETLREKANREFVGLGHIVRQSDELNKAYWLLERGVEP